MREIDETKEVMEEKRSGKNRGSKRAKGKKGGRPRVQRDATPVTNDIAWYAQYPELVNSVASFPYGYPLGSTLKYADADVTGTYQTKLNTSLPGIMSFDVVLTPGYTNSATSPITLSLRSLQTWMRHYNSGKTNYDSATLGHYILGMDGAYALYAHLSRLIVYMETINAESKYLPKAIVESMGFNYEDIQANFAQVIAAVSQFKVQLMRRPMPNHLPIFERHRWLFSNVYTDSKTSKAQLYLYKPAGIHVWEEGVDPAQPGILRFTKWIDLGWKTGSEPNELWTLTNIRNAIDNIMQPILGSFDFDTIGGDIIKAFQNDIYEVAPAEQFVHLPMYDEEVLSQIQNITIWPIMMEKDVTFNIESGLDIVENRDINAGYLSMTPQLLYVHENQAAETAFLTRDVPFITSNKLVTLNLDSPGPGDTMIATRLTSIPEKTPTSHVSGTNYATTLPLTSFGSEIVVGGTIHTITQAGTHMTTTMYQSRHLINGANTPSITQALTRVELLSHFDYAPMCDLLVYGTSSAAGRGFVFRIQDIDKYTMLTRDNLQLMHDAAILSELSWPQIPRKS